MNNKSWSQYFFEMADLASTKSKDPSTQVGAVIIGIKIMKSYLQDSMDFLVV